MTYRRNSSAEFVMAPGRRRFTVVAWAWVLTVGLVRGNTPLGSGSSLSGLWPRNEAARVEGVVAVEISPAFRFTCEGTSSARLRRAFDRYARLILDQRTLWPRHGTPVVVPEALASLTVRFVDIDGDVGEWPRLEDDESFELVIDGLDPSRTGLVASSLGGVIRGLEAFVQLTVRLGGKVVVNSTRTTVPRWRPLYRYRGLMLDTARHFQRVEEDLFTTLDAMSASSLNVLHWHLTDAQAFPWNSTAAPDLVRGAYREDLVYQSADLRAVVEYAADRGIRVIPEIDVPGHGAAMAVGRPDVVVPCGEARNDDPLYDGSVQGRSQLDPSKEATFTLLDALLGEVASIFPDEYLHLGGDEVQIRCYNTSEVLKAWMRTQGFDPACPPALTTTSASSSPMTTTTSSSSLSFPGGRRGPPRENPCANGGVGFNEMIAYFLRRVQAVALKHGKQPCGWQEIFDHYGATAGTPTPPFAGIAPETVVYDWLAPAWGWSTPETIVKAGWRVVSTLGLYLSSDQDSTHWRELLANTHPAYASQLNASARGFFNVTADPHADRLLGAEACLWGETVGFGDASARLWPRAAAVAEALWAGPSDDPDEALPRLLRHSCRLVQRNVPVTPLQPGFC